MCGVLFERLDNAQPDKALISTCAYALLFDTLLHKDHILALSFFCCKLPKRSFNHPIKDFVPI